MYKRSALAAFLCLILASFLAAQTSPAAKVAIEKKTAATGPIRYVFLVSLDGLMPASYMNPDAYGLKIPTLREIVTNGVYSPGVRGVFPSVTYPSHTAIATGTNPGTHGIVSNNPWDPLDKLRGALRFYTEDIRVPTLWDVARKNGLRTALVYWPVTVGAKADAIVPEFWRNDATPDDAKLSRAISTPGLLEAVAKEFPDFTPQFLPPRVTDAANTDIAIHLIETLRPNLLMLHIFDIDHFEHADGPLAGRGLTAVENADQQLARLIDAAKKAGIWNQTALVVVSDHGFVSVNQTFRPGVLLRQKGLITLDASNRVSDWRAWVIGGGAYAFIYVKDPDDAETRRVLLDTFRPMAGQAGSPIRRVFTHDDVVAFGGDPEVFLALEPADNFAMTGGYTGDLVFRSSEKGRHGLPPDRPEIMSSLLIYGPRIGKARLEGVRMIDIGPTVAQFLGFRLDRAEGKPLPVPLRTAAPARRFP